MTLLPSIKVSAAVSAATVNNATGTLYTAPATGYAIVQISIPTTASTITVGGRLAFTSTGAIQTIILYVGPSQALVVASNGGGVIAASGVELINS